MVSAADILLRIRGQDQTGNAFKSVGDKASHMQSTIGSAVGMAMGMVGYDLVNALVEAGRGAVNASGQLDYFAGRLGMSEQQSASFRKELDAMQEDFKKVNMTAVGATAEDLATRYQLPIDKLGDLTKMTAVMSSEFIRNGRTQEDAVLAVADAMDGQFKRLQEIGITQDTLKKNGWNGNLEDQASLIDALNKSMEEMGYDKIAKDITNLDDAYQALTVAGGNLIASVLVPLTPLIVSITEGIIGLIDFVKDNAWAQGAILIGGLAIGFGLFAGALSVAAASEAGLMALMPGFIVSLYGAASGFMAITVAGAPLWAIVAAIAAIAFAVYEVGIYFGWWKDIGSMLAAIGDGVRRLWEAFVNSPQVQGAIKMVQGALQGLWNFLQPMISWVQTQWSNIFGDAGSSPDVVSQLIHIFEQLGNVASQVFTVMQMGFNNLTYILTPLWEGLNNIAGVFSQLMSGSISWESAFIQVITSIGLAFGNFYLRIAQLALQVGQRLFGGVINYARQIPGRLWMVLTQTALRLVLFGTIAAIRARQAGMRILNGIINYIRQLPGRVGAYMMQVPGRIASAAGAAVGAAMSLASQVVAAVTSGIMGVADAVYNEFINIGSRINDAVSGAVSAAANFGSAIKDAVLSALHIASPGIIQKKIAIEFADIPGRIGESSKYVYSAARDYAGNILNGFNAPQIPLTTIRENANYTPNTSNQGAIYIVNFNEGAFDVDARNFTDKEAQGIIITAFESIDDPTTGGAA